MKKEKNRDYDSRPMIELLAFLLAVGCGLLTTFLVFLADIGPHAGPLEGAVSIWVIIAVGAFAIGAAYPKVWWAAVFVAAGLILSIPAYFDYAHDVYQYNENAYWIAFNTTVVSPFVALLAGYYGSCLGS